MQHGRYLQSRGETHILARMKFLEKLEADLKKAMLARDEVTRDTLRMLKSELITLDDPDEMAVLTRAVKSRRDSVASYREAGRQDLVDKEEAQIQVIERYLPKQLSEEEAAVVVRGLVQELGISTKKDLGRLMKEVMARYRGQIDGKLASKLAAQLLD